MTRTDSRGSHQTQKAREPESTVVIETGANEEKKLINSLRPYSHYDLAVTVFNSKGEGPPSETLSLQTHEGGENENEGVKIGRERGKGNEIEMGGGNR